MKKITFLALIVFLLISIGSYADAAGNVRVYGEYLTDENGYNYGARYFVDSTVDEAIYVYPYIYSQDNVWGDVVSNLVLLQPYEKGVNIGNFQVRDRSKGWSVDVRAKWIEVSNYPPKR
ncbi:MAG: hypothetical protein AB9895_01055 [Negativicutes bacterium]